MVTDRRLHKVVQIYVGFIFCVGTTANYFLHTTLYNCVLLPVRFMQQILIFYNDIMG
jgi:hypothetical protein